MTRESTTPVTNPPFERSKVSSSVLPMPDAHLQPLAWAGAGNASIHVDSAGDFAAVSELLLPVLQDKLDKPADLASMPNLDRVAPRRLASELATQISSMTELSDPGLDLEIQAQRKGTLVALHSNAIPDLKRNLSRLATSLVQTTCNEIEAGFQQAAAASPVNVHGYVTEARRVLEGSTPADPIWTPLKKWQECQRIADRLRQKRIRIPPSSYAHAMDALSGVIREQYDSTMHVLALWLILPAWREGRAQLLTKLADLERRSLAVRHAMSLAQKTAEAMHNDQAERQHVSEASVLRCIPGPTKDEVIAGMRHHLRVGDQPALVRRLADDFEMAIHTQCEELGFNAQSPLGDLIRDMPTRAAVTTFFSVFQRSKGKGQTTLECIDRYGVNETAEFLIRRSAPLIDLTGRDQPQTGVVPQRIRIVSLPKPHGPNDHAILERLRSRMNEIGDKPVFVEADTACQSITATSFSVGFPIAIEAQSAPLRDRYEDAADFGHLPHLFGLLPESPNGEILPAYRSSPTVDHESPS